MFGIKNPQNLLQPWKNLAQFSEELYAMFSQSEPKPEDAGPVPEDTRVPSPALPLRRPQDSLPPQNATPRARRAPSPQDRRQEIESAPAIEPIRMPQQDAQQEPPPRAAAQALAIEWQAAKRKASEQAESKQAKAEIPSSVRRTKEAPTQIRDILSQAKTPKAKIEPDGPPRPAIKPNMKPPEFKPPEWVARESYKIPDMPPPTPIPAGGGTNVFMGKVVEKIAPDQYHVTLYSNGPTDVPDDPPPVTVTIQDIDPDETIDPETWLYSIFLYQDPDDGHDIYFCKPPMWVA